MKRIFAIFFLFSIMVFMSFACSRQKEISGIEVSELLLVVLEEQNIDYCELLSEAIKGNESSIREISLLKINDGAAYGHGAVLVDLIELIGEVKFVQSIKSTSDIEKKWIKGYIEAGIEYGNNPNINGKTLKEVFPKIYEELCDKRENLPVVSDFQSDTEK